MNADRLFAHYDQIVDAPEAIGRLRRLILHFAVRGKLVPQDHKDESAISLLTRVSLNASGQLSNGVEVVPHGWARVVMGQFVMLRKGRKPASLNSEGQGLPYLDIAALEQGEIRQYSNDEECPRVAASDLIVVCDGSRSGLVLDGRDGILGSTLAGIQYSGFSREYLRVLFKSLYENLNSAKKGAAIPHLNIPRLLSLSVMLPPLAEQHRIVAKVDELMALCDRLEAARAEREATRDRLTAASLARLNTPDPEKFQDAARFVLNTLPALSTRLDQIKRVRQTILNLAVRGKLVPQDARDEPAGELLERIAKERIGPQAVKKVRRNGGAEMSSLRADTPLPGGWCWTNIDEIALSMRYGTSTKCEYAAPGVPVLRIPNVSDGVVSLDDIKFGLLTEGEMRDLALSAGDLLMIRSNGSLDIVGRSAVVTAEASGMAFAGYLVRLRLSLVNAKPEYIRLALNSTAVRDQIERPIRSAVGLKNVNLTEFGALMFPLPPLAEQHRIVAKVDELTALCERLEASLTNTATARRGLLDALLAEALAPAA